MPSAIAERVVLPRPTVPPKRVSWRLLLPVCLILLAVIYIAVLTITWPFKEAGLIETLQRRSLRKVTIQRFQQTYFPPGCIAEDVRFLSRKNPEQPAFLTVKKLVLEDNYPTLLTFQHRLAAVGIIGLHLVVPAKLPDGEPSPIMPLTYSDSKQSVVIGRISADNAELEFESKVPGKRPLRLGVNKLSLYGVGGRAPLSYDAEIHNTEPSGEISSKGTWGPWDPSNPASTPVRGQFNYRHVDLSSLPALSGFLESRGNFSGRLGQMDVSGKATVSNFRISHASHAHQLSTDIQAVVDATKGDVFLKQVLASFDRTSLLFSGSVAGKGESGKTVDLVVNSTHARLEDLLDLFISGQTAALSGNTALQGTIHLSPGSEPFLKRIAAKGSFGVNSGHFSDRNTERELARLSVNAVSGDKEEDRENPQTVVSDLKGQVNASQGVAHLKNLAFNVPGANAKLNGNFNLLSHESDLHGLLTTKGQLSEATGGAKSLLLKAITPFFKRKDHEKLVPFKITGPFGQTKISLDLVAGR